MKYSSNSRRRFIVKSALATTALSASPIVGFPNIIRDYTTKKGLISGVKLGVITYSFRAMPDQSLEATLRYIKDSGVSATELMGEPAEIFAGRPASPISRRDMFRLYRMSQRDDLTDEEKKEVAEGQAQYESYKKQITEWRASVPMSKFKKVGKMFASEGVSIYAFKPAAFSVESPDSDIQFGMNAAKAMGASHVTLEIPGNDAHTGKLGMMAEKVGIQVGYHGHEQQTPTIWDTALSQSSANMLNIDIGHYTAAGHTDTVELISAKHDRIASMHVKDRRNPANGKANMPWGEGDTPIVEVLQLMKKNSYTFPATVEMEYKVPDGSDPVKEVAKCVEYCKGALDS